MALCQQSKCGSIIAAIGFLFICVATLTPGAPSSPDAVPQVCRGWCDDSLVSDFVLNIILFVPMALGLRLAGVRSWPILIAGSWLSAVIELLQIRVIVGRDASVLDWISNTLGTYLGFVIASYWRMLVRPRKPTAAKLAAAWLLGWIGVLLLGAWGIEPAPGSYPYWGQRAPQLGEFAPFLGELLSAQVNGVELPSDRIGNDDVIRTPLGASRVHVQTVVLPGPRSAQRDIAPIARIADGAHREILMLGRAGNEVVFRYRMHASMLRLETPAFSLERAFVENPPSAVGPSASAVIVTADLDDGFVKLASRSRTDVKVRMFQFSPAMAWSFFVPWDYWFGPKAFLLSLIWLGGLLIPVAYWTGVCATGNGGTWAVLVLGGVVVVALYCVPRVFALPAPAGSEFGAAILATGLGWLLARLNRRNAPELR